MKSIGCGPIFRRIINDLSEIGWIGANRSPQVKGEKVKKISQVGRSFPLLSSDWPSRDGAQEVGKLESQQLVTVARGHPY